MIETIRAALRLSDDYFDPEIELLVCACLAELHSLGIIDDLSEDNLDPQIQTAVIAYCKWQFGHNPDADRWEHIYRDKVEKLLHMRDYGLREVRRDG